MPISFMDVFISMVGISHQQNFGLHSNITLFHVAPYFIKIFIDVHKINFLKTLHWLTGGHCSKYCTSLFHPA